MPNLVPELEISVIICAYTEERWAELLTSVESVQWQTLPPLEVLVVIDHNPSLFRRASQVLKDVTVIENHEMRGLSGARNSALAIAKGNVLAFMDEDATACADWLEMLGASYQDTSTLGVGGRIMPAWQTGRPAWFPEEFAWVVGCTYLGLPRHAAPIRNLIGCNMSFRQEVTKAVGGFRTDLGRVGTLPLGCEETELCIRAGQFWPARKFVYDPQAVVMHHVPQKRTTLSYFLSRCYSEGLSKALVSRLTGARSGLNSEWAHVLKVLPAGVAHGFRDALSHGDISGLGRAGAIISGLASTACGFLVGAISQHGKTRDRASGKTGVPAGSPGIN